MRDRSGGLKPIDRILARIPDACRVSDGRWRAPCVAHNGKARNLEIRESHDGTVLLTCRSHHCSAAEITAAAGLELRDLFPDSSPRYMRERAELDAREREAYWRDPEGYKRAAVRREIGRIQRDREARLGHHAPLRSIEIDLARRNVLKRLLGYGL